MEKIINNIDQAVANGKAKSEAKKQTCEFCEHYDERGYGYNYCSRIHDKVEIVDTGDEAADIVVAFDFGCILWEAK